MTFLAPAVLAGLFTVAIPVAVHFLLRPRARRSRFPAGAHLRAALAAGRRAQNLRDLVVLLLRAAAVAFAVLLLAGPTCQESAGPVEGQPSAVVLLVDDSWSTSYSLGPDDALSARVRQAALDELNALARSSQPVVAALLFASDASPQAVLTPDLSELRAALLRHPAPVHARTLGSALHASAVALARAAPPHRELVVATDGAAHAWRDVGGGILRGVAGLTVRIVAPATPPRSNLALTNVSVPSGVYPETAPLRLTATIRADGVDTTCWLSARGASQTLARVGPIVLEAGQPRDVPIVIPPMAAGMHQLALEIEPTDRLPQDQVRYVVVETGPRPVVWLVRAGGAGHADLTAMLLRNLLAPELLEDERQLVALIECNDVPSPDVVPAAQDGPRMIVLMANTPLSAESRAALRAWVDRGAALVLMPVSEADAVDWPGARSWFTSDAPATETLVAVTAWRWPDVLRASAGSAIDELTRAAVRRRVVLGGLAEGVRVEAEYSDGSPALVSLRRGKGRAFLFTTSPDPQWSEFGIRAAGLLAWFHERLRATASDAGRVAGFVAHTEARHAFAGLSGPARVSVRRVAPDAAREGTVALEATPAPAWPADSPGLYEVYQRSTAAILASYAVNWPAEESELTPIAADRLSALLGVADVRVEGAAEADGHGGTAGWAGGFRQLRATDVFAGALLVLLVVEQLGAGGVFRRSPRSTEDAAGG